MSSFTERFISFTRSTYQYSLRNSYCILDNLVPKINLYLLSEYGAVSETVRRWGLCQMQGMTFFMWQISFTFHDQGDRNRRASEFPFYSTDSFTHLPIYLLINEYLRARHKLNTSDAAVRKTQVVPPSRSLQRRCVMSECHEGDV